MNDWLDACVWRLAWTTAAVSVSAVLVAVLLRGLRTRSVAVHRTAWLLVLLQGILVYKLPVDLPLAPAIGERPPWVEAQYEPGPMLHSEGAIKHSTSSRVADVDPIPEQPHHVAEVSGPSALPWQSVLSATWLLGIVVLLGQSIWRYFMFLRRLPRVQQCDHGWLAELEDVRKPMQVRSSVTLHVTEQLGPAICWAPGGYRLLVPFELWRRLSSDARCAVLRHEFAHVVRGDLWTSLLARLLVLPQWFNPLAWWAVRRYEECAEWACDDLARGTQSDGEFDYARTLLALGESDLASPALPHVAARGGAMSMRIKRLLVSVPPKESIMKRIWILGLMCAVSLFGLLQFRVVSADPPPSPASADAQLPEDPAPTPSVGRTEIALDLTPEDAASGDLDFVSESNDAISFTQPEPSNRYRRGRETAVAEEAIIDMSRVFKQYRRFLQRQDALKSRIATQEDFVREKQKYVQQLKQRLFTESPRDPETADTLRKTEAMLVAELQADVTSMRRELLLAEAKMYHESYEEVRAEVARYAKQHGIRVVRKSNTVVGDAQEVDPTDREAILARLNREIVYAEPQYVDITDAILMRLNARATPDSK